MRPLSDLEKSSLSFALGMTFVLGAVGWKTNYDVSALTVTLAIPSSLFAIWGFFEKRAVQKSHLRIGLRDEMRHALMLREHDAKIATSVREKLDTLMNSPSLESTRLNTPTKIERRVLSGPDSEVLRRRMLLIGRDPFSPEDGVPFSEVNPSDQWHN